MKRSLVEAAQTHKPVLVGARCDEGNCTRPPRYGAEGQLPTRCVLHKQPGQVELRGRCAEPGTWPTCGESPCTRRATFNKPGVLPPVACALHKTAGMELVVRLSKAPRCGYGDWRAICAPGGSWADGHAHAWQETRLHQTVHSSFLSVLPAALRRARGRLLRTQARRDRRWRCGVAWLRWASPRPRPWRLPSLTWRWRRGTP